MVVRGCIRHNIGETKPKGENISALVDRHTSQYWAEMLTKPQTHQKATAKPHKVRHLQMATDASSAKTIEIGNLNKVVGEANCNLCQV